MDSRNCAPGFVLPDILEFCKEIPLTCQNCGKLQAEPGVHWEMMALVRLVYLDHTRGADEGAGLAAYTGVCEFLERCLNGSLTAPMGEADGVAFGNFGTGSHAEPAENAFASLAFLELESRVPDPVFLGQVDNYLGIR